MSKLWAAHSATALRIVVAFMTAVGLFRLGDGVHRLVWRTDRPAAIDLRFRYSEVHAWFDGIPVYREFAPAAVYPPATYSLLWPLLGWLPLGAARALWLVISVTALWWTANTLQRESLARSQLSRAFVVLMLLGINQTGVALGNGQLILVMLPPLLIGVFLIQRGKGTWTEDLLAASCLTFVMVKFTITVPFLWLALLLPVVPIAGQVESNGWRLRPAVLVAAAYGSLTLLAAHFQPQGLRELFLEWLAVAPSSMEGYSDVHTWLDALGRPDLRMPASALLFLALGAWTYRYRSVDLWLRLGVAALVARFWAYHRLYDDVLVVLALVALFRIAFARTLISEEPLGGRAFAAWALLGVATFLIFLPARLQEWPAPWYLIFNHGNALSWFTVLMFLCREAELERKIAMRYTPRFQGV